MPKVSVIVPVYGVERYIERCARSLFEQTLDDMEYIFVDDCSKDSSISVLENVITQYPLRKGQVRIVHHEQNKGVSRARETGVREALGEYIAHCDSDDWVEPGMYESMYNYAIQNNCDFVKCAHAKTDGKDIRVVCRAKAGKDMSRDIVVRWALQIKGWDSLWDTLVKHDVYVKSRPEFTDNAMLEDFFLSVQLLCNSEKIGYIDVPFYNYFVNPTSCCNTSDMASYVKRATQARVNANWIISYVKKYVSVSPKDINTTKWAVKNMLIPIMDDKDNRKIWDDIYPEITYKVLFLTPISWRDKLRFYSAEFNLYKCFKR